MYQERLFQHPLFIKLSRISFVLPIDLQCTNLSIFTGQRSKTFHLKNACPLAQSHQSGSNPTAVSRPVDLEEKIGSFTYPFLVLQAVLHRFPPLVLWWTSLCSCLHLPISEWLFRLSTQIKYPTWTTANLLKVFKSLSQLVPSCRQSRKIGKTVCPSTLLP